MTDIYAKHLSGMVQIPTVSNPDPSKVDYSQFDKLHAYLENTYPLIHKTMEKKVIGRASLLFKWAAENPAKEPILLMAHQDVVPEGDHANWKYPPFSGEIAEGFVWGRGSYDCKSTLVAELETVEALIASGFKPDFDIYLAFGENEEVYAPTSGADQIAQYLASQSVHLGAVFDEGGEITYGSSGYNGYVAEVFVGEKACQDYELYNECEGGHSSAPGKGTALGKVAKAVVAIEANPLPYRLTETVRAQLKALAKGMTGEKAEIYANPDDNFDKLCDLAQEDKLLDTKLHTSCAFTMAYGSAQSNILPEKAGVILNCRALQGDTIESLMARFRSLIPDDVKIRYIDGPDPKPATSTDSEVYRLTEHVLKNIYGNILVVPGLIAGATDSRYYAPVCENIFRFTGYLKDDTWGQAHMSNERIPCSAIESSVKFFTELIKNY